VDTTNSKIFAQHIRNRHTRRGPFPPEKYQQCGQKQCAADKYPQSSASADVIPFPRFASLNWRD